MTESGKAGQARADALDVHQDAVRESALARAEADRIRRQADRIEELAEAEKEQRQAERPDDA